MILRHAVEFAWYSVRTDNCGRIHGSAHGICAARFGLSGGAALSWGRPGQGGGIQIPLTTILPSMQNGVPIPVVPTDPPSLLATGESERPGLEWGSPLGIW